MSAVERPAVSTDQTTSTTIAVRSDRPAVDDGSGAGGFIGAGIVLLAAVALATVQARRKTLKR